MENKDICNYNDLLTKITFLRSEKLRQEQVLKYSFKELLSTLNPVTIVKESLHDFATDQQVQFDVAKIGLNLGANFVIDKIFGKHQSVKGFLSSSLLEKFSTSFINKNLSNLIEGVSSLVSKKKEINQ